MSVNGAVLRVVIADDSVSVRKRMVSLLSENPSVEVTAESSDVPSTIESVRTLRPHVLLLDISMPGGCGLDVLNVINTEHIPSKVLVLTNYSEPEYEAMARKGGAVAFLDKARDFLKAVDYVNDFAKRTYDTPGVPSVAFTPPSESFSSKTHAMSDYQELDETLDLVRSMRDSLRTLITKAELQNASIRSSYHTEFTYSLSLEEETPFPAPTEGSNPTGNNPE